MSGFSEKALEAREAHKRKLLDALGGPDAGRVFNSAEGFVTPMTAEEIAGAVRDLGFASPDGEEGR